ncbi:MAG TPA: glucose-6-phosphate isomerase [Bacteroidales bacterium]|nr:glucose-6-phosphate isomerase [Bacteroidales bacterium]
MEALKIDISKVFGFVPKTDIYKMEGKAIESVKALEQKTGKGNDFLGWVNLPSSISDADLKDIEKTCAKIRKKVEAVVVIGIGGSYLGTRAVSEALSPVFFHLKASRKNPVLLYAGHNIGEDYLNELMDLLNDMKYAIVVISKSGTTTEPAIAFRILKNHLEKKEGKEAAKELIIAITDAKKGALRTTATQEGYKTYVIPDDVGGRYSVLTPVGLVPLALGGVDIRALVKGAADMEKLTASSVEFAKNPACIYAAARYMLYRSGKKIEILANFENKLHFLAEWWKQLYGESEGKEGKGIFPASVDLSADLHSMGQYIQEGERILMETVISISEPATKLAIPKEKADLDGLNYIAGKRIDSVNKMAELGTALAHVDGGVPNIHIEIPKLNEYYLGQIMYFFEKACGISGYLLGVNPFDQPGVEAYKKNMFALLEKPGFEAETKKIKSRI